MKKIYLFKFKYILSLLIIILIIKKIETIPNFKAICLSKESCYIINYDGIYTYNFNNNSIKIKLLLFTQGLESENEFEMIGYDIIDFNSIQSTLIFVKTNLYFIKNIFLLFI